MEDPSRVRVVPISECRLLGALTTALGPGERRGRIAHRLP
jgi:hypothetical protein